MVINKFFRRGVETIRGFRKTDNMKCFAHLAGTKVILDKIFKGVNIYE